MTSRYLTRALAGAVSMFLLAGCVTQPEPCTPEWVEWKTDRILNEFARDNRDIVRALQDVSGDIESPSALMAVRLATLVVNAEGFARDFDEIVMPELNNAIAQCGEPRQFIPMFTYFLRDQGVGEDVIDWVEALGYLAGAQTRS